MAVTNRTLDVSEQRRIMQFGSAAAVGVGATVVVGTVPFNATLDAIRVCADGVSGAPTYTFKVNRFIAGTGLTTIAAGISTLTAASFGTSGMQSVGLAVSGSTLLNLLAGDVLLMSTSGANTNALSLSVSAVIKAVADIKSNFGL